MFIYTFSSLPQVSSAVLLLNMACLELSDPESLSWLDLRKPRLHLVVGDSIRQGRSSPVEDRGRLFQERGRGGGRILDIAGPAAASDRAALAPGCGGEGDEAGQRRNLANGQ